MANRPQPERANRQKVRVLEGPPPCDLGQRNHAVTRSSASNSAAEEEVLALDLETNGSLKHQLNFNRQGCQNSAYPAEKTTKEFALLKKSESLSGKPVAGNTSSTSSIEDEDPDKLRRRRKRRKKNKEDQGVTEDDQLTDESDDCT